ncbi:MAG: chromate transporter [Erysipelothrix sp.]|nr:chromate transporter [Erysipelothrix sp.]
MKKTIEMFIAFFKVGLFTFGGGYAMIPIARRQIIENKGWITEEELMDYYGISQVSMGIIAINTSALMGYRIDKEKGALIAAVASALPSIIIITVIAAVFEGMFDYPVVVNMFKAIRIVVSALIVHTTYKLMKIGIIDLFGWILFAVSFLGVVLFNVNPILLVVPSAILGFFFYPKNKAGKE